MKIEINIDDYLSKDEMKQLCIEYFKNTLAADPVNTERILDNMAYSAAFKILDSVLTANMMLIIRKKVNKRITDISDFDIFRKKDAWGSEDSEAYLEVKKAVSEHKHLINGLVKKAILEHDFSKHLPDASDYIGECIVDALKKGLS
jgi:hypothetical protein